MGAWGAPIMSFFGTVFAALTIYWQWQLSGITLALPFLGFVLVGLAASYVIRTPGRASSRHRRKNEPSCGAALVKASAFPSR